MSHSRTGRARAGERGSAAPAQLLLTIEKLVAGGAGFARSTGGEPVFVRGALPGDAVRVDEVRQRKGYVDAMRWTLVSASPDRRSPPCGFAKQCGGCDVMALTPAAQRRVKHDMVVEILRRTARVDTSASSATPLHFSADDAARDALGYRSRIRLHIDDQSQLGFFAEQSHVVVPVAHCLVATERVNTVLEALVALSKLRPELLTAFEQVEVRALGEQADLVWVARRDERRPRRPKAELIATLGTIERHLQSEAPTLTLQHVLAEDAPQRWREFVQGVDLHVYPSPTNAVAPTRLWFAPGTFTQVNWQVNTRLVADLVSAVTARGARRFLDLYCGAGNFSLPLLAAGLDGLGVETNPTSIAAASAAATAQNLGGRFIAQDVATAVQRLVADAQQFDLIILDPPRAGFREVAPLLRGLSPRHVFICACDPVTFARDLRSLVEQGFVLDQLRAYDMFPQTHHVECSAWLSLTTSPSETPLAGV